MNRSLLIRIGIWLFVLAVITGLYLYRKATRLPASSVAAATTPFEPRTLKLDPLELVERSGRTFHFSELAGRVWVASFFFSTCPGPCRILNGRIAELQQRLGDAPVTIVSITVDPARDTPARLAEYAERFGADPAQWLFLTGEAATIEELAQQLSVAAGVAEGHRDLAHTDRLIPVDRHGRTQRPHAIGTDAGLEALVRELRTLAEEAP